PHPPRCRRRRHRPRSPVRFRRPRAVHRHTHRCPVTVACDSATGSRTDPVVVNGGTVAPRPPPDQDTDQVTVAVSVNALPGAPAELTR
ncbi:hypothetical protein DKL51_01720, partial [Micromonospora globispora]